MNLRTPVVVMVLIAAIGASPLGRTLAQDFFASSPPVAGYSYAPATGVPAMPPPPTLTPPPAMGNAISGPYVAMQQPPVITAPPVAQGFGTGVAPIAPGGASAVMPAQPYYTEPLPANPSISIPSSGFGRSPA